jgi:hypothetical protein
VRLFRGKRHRSLSEVARVITGSRWSGPLFFGLKARAKEYSSEIGNSLGYYGWRSTCADDMNKMGLELISFTIKEVRDKNESSDKTE